MHVFRCPQCHGRGIALADSDAMPMCLDHAAPMTMERLPDTAQALLPMDPARTGTIGPAKVEALRAVGILMPETQHALDWMYRHRKTNGMAEAFLLVGGRRCIDLVAFARLMREQRA